MMTNEEAKRFMREHFVFIKVPLVPVVEAKPVVYYTVCYGCGTLVLEGEEYRKDFCSEKCFCETSSIP